MTNLCKLLKNSEGDMFYSPMIGVCKLLSNDGCYLILEADATKFKLELDEFGRYFSEQECECLLYPSKTNRDWSTYMLIPPDTPVMVKNGCNSWELRYYACSNKCFNDSKKQNETQKTSSWIYIIPVSEFDFNDLTSNINKSIC